MKKILVAMLVLVIIMSITSCSNPSSETTATTTNTESAANESTPQQDTVVDRAWLEGKTITIVMGFKAGGSLDVMVRQLIPFWQETAKCTFVVENRVGANGQLSSQHVLWQPKDATTLLAYTETYQSNMYVSQNPGFGIDDFSIINMQVVDPATLTVLKDSPYQTIEALIKAIQDNPGQITCANIQGSAGNILLEILKEEYKLDFKIVTYEGGADMRTALLGKHVDFMAGTASGDLGLGDSAMPLVVVGDKRNDIWPDTPCTTEAWPKLDVPLSLGSSRIIALPAEAKKNHPERFLALVETYKEALENPEYLKMRQDNGTEAVTHFYGPEESDALQRSLFEFVEKYKDALSSN